MQSAHRANVWAEDAPIVTVQIMAAERHRTLHVICEIHSIPTFDDCTIVETSESIPRGASERTVWDQTETTIGLG